MREGWEIKKLGDVCEKITRGISPKYTDENGVIVLNQKCIRDHKINFEFSRKHDEVIKKVNSEKYIKIGDVLVNSTGEGTLGRISQVRELNSDKITVDSHISIVRPMKDKFFLDFFGWAMIFIENEIEKSGAGASGQTELARTVLENNFTLVFPKFLPEQQRIVAILDKAFDAIAKAKTNAEQNLKNAKELFESYLQGVFENKGIGWEEKKLIDVCELIMGQSPAGETYNVNGIGFPLINGPVEFGREPFSKTIKSKFTTEPTKYCKEGDLILCVRGSTTGRINIAGFDACIGRGVAAIRYSKNQFWLNYFILSSRKMIYDLGTGATFPNVSGEILKNLLIPIPTLKEQHTIVQKLDALSAETKKLEAIYKKKLEDLEELKKSILQKAFSGELIEKEVIV